MTNVEKLFNATSAAICLLTMSSLSCKALEPDHLEFNKIMIVLNQRSDCYGEITAYLNADSLLMKVNDSNVYLIAYRPDWHVMVCNDETKKAFSLDLNRWLKHAPRVVYLGEDWDRFGMQLKTVGRRQLTSRDRFVSGLSPNSSWALCTHTYNSMEYKTVNVPWVSMQACHILQRALNCPQTDGIPISLTLLRKSKSVTAFEIRQGGLSHFLTTSKISEIDKALPKFLYPKNYSFCKTEAEVVQTESRKGQTSDFAKLMN